MKVTIHHLCEDLASTYLELRSQALQYRLKRDLKKMIAQYQKDKDLIFKRGENSRLKVQHD